MTLVDETIAVSTKYGRIRLEIRSFIVLSTGDVRGELISDSRGYAT